MKKISKVLSGIIYALIVLIFILAIYVVYCVVSCNNKNQTPTVFGKQIYIVETESMTPTIKIGDLIVTKVTSIDQVKEEDIITFVCVDSSQSIYGQSITHRVVEIIPATESSSGKLELITKGDNNTVNDSFSVTEDNFIGVVTKISTGLGSFIGFFTGKSMSLIFVVIFIVILILLCTDVISILKTKKEYDKEKEAERLKKELTEEILKEYQHKEE